MKYLLIHNLDSYLKDKILNGYLKDNFIIVYQKDNNILIKKSDVEIVDEELFVKVLFSYLLRSRKLLDEKSFVCDLSNAFSIAFTQNGFSKFDNRFEWMIRNTMMREVLKEEL